MWGKGDLIKKGKGRKWGLRREKEVDGGPVKGERGKEPRGKKRDQSRSLERFEYFA